MAERSVIREDVVSIGFEVENNPFGDLAKEIDGLKASLGLLDDAEAGLKDIGREAGLAQDAVGGLADSLRGPPDKDGLAKPVEEVGDAAGEAGKELQGLSAKMGDIREARLTDGILKLAPALRPAVSGMKDLAGKAASFTKEKLDAGVKKIPPPLKSAAGMAGKVLGKARDLAGIGFQKAVSGMKSLADQAGRAAKALGGKALSGAASLGKGVATGIMAGSVALAGMGTAAVAVGAGFEASMSQVAATMGMTADEASYSNETYAMLANTAKEMGAKTKFSASESAEALNYMALAGYDAGKSCAALPTVLNLAASGGMELAAASDMVTDSMSALGIEATQENLEEFGDKLAKTAQKSNTSVAQLGEAVLTVGGTAKTLAGGTTELNTLLGIIADNGVKGAEGGTALRNIMLSLQAPTDTAAKKMRQLGLDVYDAEGKMRPMNQILGDLNDSMADMTDQGKQDVLSTIFNKNDLKSVNALLANSGDRYSELSGYIDDSAGAMTDMAETMNDNLTGRVTEFKSAVEGAGIAIYEALGSSNLKGLVQQASGWVGELTKATEEGGIGGLVGQLGGTLSEAVTTVGGYLPSIVESGAAIVDSLAEGLLDNQDEIMGSVTGAVFALGEGILRVAPKMMSAGMGLAASLVRGVASNLPRLIPAAGEGIRAMKDGLAAHGPELVATAGSLVGQLASGLVSAAPMLISSAAGMVANLVNGISQGLPSVVSTGIALIGSFVSGIAANVPQLLSSGINLIVSIVQGIGQGIPNIFQSAGSIIGSLLEGLISNIPNLITGAWELVKALVGGILSTDWLQVGKDIIGGIYNGIKSCFGGEEEKTAVEISEGVASGIDTAKMEASGQQMSASLADGLNSQTPQLQLAAAGQADAMRESFQAGFSDIQADADGFSKDVKATIDSTDLYSSGQDIMRGLNSGMLSMQGTLNATASSIGSGISSNLNQSLDIHSPSRVTEETGRFTGLGLGKGLEGTKDRAMESARGIGGTVARNIAPFRSRYAPETSPSVINNRSLSQVSNYSPVFNLTLNGASASDSNERKVKRWVKESMKECFDGIGRSQLRPQEV